MIEYLTLTKDIVSWIAPGAACLVFGSLIIVFILKRFGMA